jgi:hypothetical protein
MAHAAENGRALTTSIPMANDANSWKWLLKFRKQRIAVIVTAVIDENQFVFMAVVQSGADFTSQDGNIARFIMNRYNH